MANRLRNALSPYLRQHADNPVDWWPWCDQAFEQARLRDVPVLLSVGYAACHWCHVMAHESFEDLATADFMNRNYVNIKVDREERPDVDAIYMAATTAMTGSGGWPMTVILDHEARAFFAGTYFPKRPRPGMPAFLQVLSAVSHAWQHRRADVMQAASGIDLELRHREDAPISAREQDGLLLTDVRAAVAALVADFDDRNGGFGGAPKFPPAMVVEFLLRAEWLLAQAGTPDPEVAAMAGATLVAMARGGMFDQLGGGFARYSVDAAWVVPHFEKMLYDNALLLRAYLHWWRRSGDPLAARVIRLTAEFLLRELRTPEGGFAASLDADSPPQGSQGRAVEGAYYVWTESELQAALGPGEASWVAQLCGVTDTGTFENGASVLQMRHDPDDQQRWERCRRALLLAREARPRPARDDKVIAEWNGLVIAALVEAGTMLGEPAWVDAAIRAAELQVQLHWDPASGLLHRVSLAGEVGQAPGVLADYASLAEGLLTLYQCTGHRRWLEFAQSVLAAAVRGFTDGDGGFYETRQDGPQLVRRPRGLTDGVTPSGWSALAAALTTSAAITADDDQRQQAERALSRLAPLAREAPRYSGWVWATVAAQLAGPWQVGIVTDLGQSVSPEATALLRAAIGASSPGLVVALGEVGASGPALLHQRMPLHGRPTAYACRDFVCELPTNDPAMLAAQLGCPVGQSR